MHTANVAVKLLVAVLSLLSVGTGLPVANSSRRLSERSPQMQGLGQAKAVEAVSAPAPAAAAAATGLAPAATLPIGLATPAPAMLPSTAVPVVQGVPAVGMPAAVPAPSSPAAVPAEEAVAAVGLIRPVLAPMPAEPAAVGQVGQALSQHMPAAKRAAVAQLSAGLAAEPVVPAGQQPTAVSSLPMGTYTQSCQACVFDNHVLRCARCEDGKRGCRNGDFSGCADGAHEVQVDLTGCSSEVVENNHGRLRCSSSSAASRGMGGPVAGGGGHRMGSDLTYSQNYQDTWVVRLAASNGWVGQGYFLDLGAFNGVYCSNSKLLEDILGWDGVCVEPFPTHSYDGGLFEARRCLLVDRALTGTLDGKTVEMEGDGTDQSTSLDLQKAASSPVEPTAHAKNAWVTTTISIGSLLACINGTNSCVVGDNTANGQAAQQNRQLPSFINFVSMDVEGLEYDVLQAWPFDKVRVGAWIVEHNDEEPKRANIISLLKTHGYERYSVANAGVDDYFVDPQYWKAELADKAWRKHPSGSHGC